MCGRLTLTADKKEKLQDLVPDAEIAEWHGPRYNLAPSQKAPVIKGETGHRIDWLQWGLVPHWANDAAIGNRLINARAETVAEKPAFRSAYAKQRCVVFADGFYEWQAVPGARRKQPWFISAPGRRMFPIAGLWERWDKGDRPLETFTLITTTANKAMSAVHHRMPVILNPETIEAWLQAAGGSELLAPCSEDRLVFQKVSTLVNNTRNDGPELLEEPETGNDEGEDQPSLF